ncbi:hypothetical protein B0H14DRAFT_3859994 [Mycena olivaceomarginata]|nr:hypothetical protein B0H14DRAFT_3859994 [Mycena olivaceomarginata]
MGLLTGKIMDHISQFLFALTAPQELEKPKLLVFGNLGLYSSEQANLSIFKDISSHPTLDGFFGIIPEELVVLFSRFSHNRRETLDMENGLTHKLGYCAAPPRHLGNNVYHQPPSVYNFDLVLNHIATTLNLEGAQHRTLADSPWLKPISLCCRHLLQYSSLRRGRGIDISQLGLPDLNTHTTNESHLWQLLLRLGCPRGEKRKEPRFDVDFGTLQSFAANQLFSQFHPFPHPRESTRDIQLRALLERNPRPIVGAIARRLRHTHLLDLYKMSEAVFQEMWNGFMAVECELVDDGVNEFREDSKYINNYFAQLGLKPFGYLDIFMCAFRDSLSPRLRVRKKCHDFVNGTGGKSTFWQKCEKKLQDLDKLSEEQIRNINVHFYQSPESGGEAEEKRFSIGYIVEQAEGQLRSYMNAIVNGQAYGGKHYGSRIEGIQKYETRVQATKVPSNDVDQVIGLIIYGVGRRVFWVVVEPEQQNTLYRYDAKPGWKNTWGEWAKLELDRTNTGDSTSAAVPNPAAGSSKGGAGSGRSKPVAGTNPRSVAGPSNPDPRLHPRFAETGLGPSEDPLLLDWMEEYSSSMFLCSGDKFD